MLPVLFPWVNQRLLMACQVPRGLKWTLGHPPPPISVFIVRKGLGKWNKAQEIQRDTFSLRARMCVRVCVCGARKIAQSRRTGGRCEISTTTSALIWTRVFCCVLTWRQPAQRPRRNDCRAGVRLLTSFMHFDAIFALLPAARSQQTLRVTSLTHTHPHTHLSRNYCFDFQLKKFDVSFWLKWETPSFYDEIKIAGVGFLRVFQFPPLIPKTCMFGSLNRLNCLSVWLFVCVWPDQEKWRKSRFLVTENKKVLTPFWWSIHKINQVGFFQTEKEK